jgi:hypothetical protein
MEVSFKVVPGERVYLEVPKIFAMVLECSVGLGGVKSYIVAHWVDGKQLITKVDDGNISSIS